MQCFARPSGELARTPQRCERNIGASQLADDAGVAGFDFEVVGIRRIEEGAHRVAPSVQEVDLGHVGRIEGRLVEDLAPPPVAGVDLARPIDVALRIPEQHFEEHGALQLEEEEQTDAQRRREQEEKGSAAHVRVPVATT